MVALALPDDSLYLSGFRQKTKPIMSKDKAFFIRSASGNSSLAESARNENAPFFSA
jgi:hypothetical protein